MTPSERILDPLSPAASLAFHEFWQAVLRDARWQQSGGVVLTLADLTELSRSAFGTGYWTGVQHANGVKVRIVE